MRVELITVRLEDECSIQLSYEEIFGVPNRS